MTQPPEKPAADPDNAEALPGDLYNAPVPAENADPDAAAPPPDRAEGVASS